MPNQRIRCALAFTVGVLFSLSANAIDNGFTDMKSCLNAVAKLTQFQRAELDAKGKSFQRIHPATEVYRTSDGTFFSVSTYSTAGGLSKLIKKSDGTTGSARVLALVMSKDGMYYSFLPQGSSHLNKIREALKVSQNTLTPQLQSDDGLMSAADSKKFQAEWDEALIEEIRFGERSLVDDIKRGNIPTQSMKDLAGITDELTETCRKNKHMLEDHIQLGKMISGSAIAIKTTIQANYPDLFPTSTSGETPENGKSAAKGNKY